MRGDGFRAFLRGVASVFDLGGSYAHGGEIPPPRPPAPGDGFARDREAIRRDWAGLLPPAHRDTTGGRS
jgi:hypothetical protein